MTNSSSAMLEATMSGLEAGLRVLHIATFNPQFCRPDTDTGQVLADEALRDFDYIPVKDGQRCVGVLRRGGGATDGPVSTRMDLLTDAMIVSADAPLSQFIPIMAGEPYRLVVGGPQIQGVVGIVTRSDMLKLPVRLLAFTQVTHLEMVLAEVIRARCASDDEWMDRLSPSRRKGVRDKIQEARDDGIDPPALEFTGFCDKRDIVAKLYRPGKSFKDDLKKIEDLRNTVAHAGSYAGTETQLKIFLEALRLTSSWTDQLHTRLAGPQGEAA